MCFSKKCKKYNNLINKLSVNSLSSDADISLKIFFKVKKTSNSESDTMKLVLRYFRSQSLLILMFDFSKLTNKINVSFSDTIALTSHS